MAEQSSDTKLLAEALDAVAEAAILVDAAGVIRHANRAIGSVFASVEDYRSITGQPAAGFLVGLANDGEFADPEDNDRLGAIIEAPSGTADAKSQAQLIRLSDGRWIDCRASVCSSGATVLLISDQTAMIKKDILLEDLAAGLGDGVAIWGQSGTLALMSNSYAGFLNAGAANGIVERPDYRVSLDRWMDIGEVAAESNAFAGVDGLANSQDKGSRWGFTVRLPDGRDLLVRERRTRDGGVASIVADVTNLKDIQRALAEKTETLELSLHDLEISQAATQAEHKIAEDAKAHLQSILENMIEGLAIVDRDGRITSANPAAKHIFGLPDGSLPGRSFVDLFDDDARENVARVLDEAHDPDANDEAGFANDIVINHPDGQRRFVSLRIGHATQIGGDVRIVTLRDTTSRKELEQELTTLATTDPLTGLYNRRKFREIAEGEYERLKRFGSVFSILVMDIDHFKAINDRHGHAAGDAALVKFAEVCRATLREVDFAGRLGGEEFAAVLPATDTVGALNAAERLRRAVETTRIEDESSRFQMTFSTGAHTLDADTVSLDDAFRDADEALYLAKTNGRNRVELAAKHGGDKPSKTSQQEIGVLDDPVN